MNSFSQAQFQSSSSLPLSCTGAMRGVSMLTSQTPQAMNTLYNTLFIILLFLGARYELGIYSGYGNLHADWSSVLCVFPSTKVLLWGCKWRHVRIKYMILYQWVLRNKFYYSFFLRIFWTIFTKLMFWRLLRRYSCSSKWWQCSPWSCTCSGCPCSTLSSEQFGQVFCMV